jgi:3-oxoacyl-[acyl-carrier-protein] synthase III
VVVSRTGHFHQNGPAVHKFAIKMMTSLLQEIQERAGPERADRVIYIGHQANYTMLESVRRRRDVPVERHFYNIVDYGNQSAAGAPAVISQNWDRFRDGDIAAVTVVGSGLSWSSLQIEIGADPRIT